MSRYRAALYHLSISLVVFVALAYVVLFIWFPDFFFAIDGGWEGMRIIIGVDLVLGPLLTLIVFKAGKPGLKFDLTLIGIFQAVCLAAGLYVIHAERPTFFVYYDRHFYSSSNDTFTDYGIEAPDYSQFDDASPAHVYVALPENPIEEADMRRVLYNDGVPLWAYPKLYRPLDEHMSQVVEEGIAEERLRARDESGALDNWLARYGGEFADYAFLPIHSRYRDAFLGVRKADKSFVDILEVPPPLSSVEPESLTEGVQGGL